MAAFNVVRFRVKPGGEQKFIDAHRHAQPWKGMRQANLIRTGEHTFCIIGEWDDMAALAAARPDMIALLDTFRDTLEDQGGNIGVTDAVSGDVVVRMAPETSR